LKPILKGVFAVNPVLSAEALAGEAKVDFKKWNKVPSEKGLKQAIEALETLMFIMKP